LGKSRAFLPHVPQSDSSHHHGLQSILLVTWEGNGSAQNRKFKGSPPQRPHRRTSATGKPDVESETSLQIGSESNRKSHLNNKRLYDKRAKPREFEVQDLVYLYNPALKSGLSRKFAKPWIGPCQITKKISELIYEIVDSKGKRQVVHLNRLKKLFNPEFWNPKPRQKPERNAPREVAKPQRAHGNSQDDVKIGPYPLVCPQNSEVRTEQEPLGDHSPDTPDLSQHPTDTPLSDRNDPSYQPPDKPTSRRELQNSRTQPPLTRLRAKVISQNAENL
jgi:hypothetical protein